MYKGLIMTGMGMGVVFSVLVIILIATSVLAWMGRTFPALADVPAPAPQKKRARAPEGVAAQGITDEEHAAVKAALAKHMDMKPDQFDLEIK